MATYDFKDKRILVTGAGAGIGKAIVQKLAASNAKVVALSLIKEELNALKAEIPSVETVQVDLRDWAATRRAVEGVMPVDGLVNNAGVALNSPFLEATEEEFDLTYAVNVKALINVSQVVAKSMIDNNIKGSIVHISSIAALKALQDHLSYCGSKASVDALTRGMALELGPKGIRVNSVNPTVVLTALGRRVWADPTKQNKLLARLPLGHFAEELDVVNAVFFLLGEESSMVSGMGLKVDGGYGSV